MQRINLDNLYNPSPEIIASKNLSIPHMAQAYLKSSSQPLLSHSLLPLLQLFHYIKKITVIDHQCIRKRMNNAYGRQAMRFIKFWYY